MLWTIVPIRVLIVLLHHFVSALHAIFISRLDLTFLK